MVVEQCWHFFIRHQMDGTYKKRRHLIQFKRCLFVITIERSMESQISLKFLGASKPKGLNRIATFEQGHLRLRELNLSFNNKYIIQELYIPMLKISYKPLSVTNHSLLRDYTNGDYLSTSSGYDPVIVIKCKNIIAHTTRLQNILDQVRSKSPII